MIYKSLNPESCAGSSKNQWKKPRSLFHTVEKVTGQKINPGNLGESWGKAFKK